MSAKTIALVGNPNCGKTTLFNKLTGSKQKVGNWSGVTVEKKQGEFTHQQAQYQLVDLPGIYTLSVANRESAVDERIACEYLLHSQTDCIINIVDAANLERNLYLTLQLLELGIPIIVAVNMLDIAKQRNINIDLAQLSAKLSCPVVPLVSTKSQGIGQLQNTLAQVCQQSYYQVESIPFPGDIETAINDLKQTIEQQDPTATHTRWQAIRLLEQDVLTQDLCLCPEVGRCVLQNVTTIERVYQEDTDIILADSRYQSITNMMQSVISQQSSSRKTFTQMIDAVVMHRWLGIPIFLAIMYLMFELSMNIGTLLQPLFDISSTVLFIDGIHYLGQQWGAPLWLVTVLANGVGLGINTVVNFIPQIGLMFLFLSFLEDSGYMARAAFVMDRFMQWVGLPGKSFVPLIVGFGCNVPSIMATRTLDNNRDRILTSVMSPFMSCGARLAIFVVFASAFFPQHGAVMVFLLYITGIIVAILTGLLFKKTLLKGNTTPYVMELPIYHLPNSRNIFTLTWGRLKRFVFRAGKLIVPICVIIGSLNAIQIDGHIDPQGSDQSILSYVGRSITPVFHPIGVTSNNWPATVGLITGTLAKEVVVGTLNTLYSQKETGKKLAHYSLWGGLEKAVLETGYGFRGVFSTTMLNPFTANEADGDISQSAMGHMVNAFSSQWAAFAYLLFVLLYVPCVSTIAALAREVGKRWAIISTAWSFYIAYALAVVFYQASILLESPISALSWIMAVVISAVIIIWSLKYYSNSTQSQLSKGVA